MNSVVSREAGSFLMKCGGADELYNYKSARGCDLKLLNLAHVTIQFSPNDLAGGFTINIRI